MTKKIFLDPSYDVFYKNNIFNSSDDKLNRDDQLLPFIRLKQYYEKKGIEVLSADYLFDNNFDGYDLLYYSFGLNGYEKLLNRKNVKLKAMVLMEPPLVAPRLYSALPRLTDLFENVYLHNTVGDGYSLSGVNRSKLHKLYVPQPYEGIKTDLWSNKSRLNKIVAISGNHNPRFRSPEYYSKRIKFMSTLSSLNAIDLYGKGWGRWWSKQSMWPTYWIYKNKINSIYRGECISKLDILSKYNFCLCLENTPMAGYITEKIIDCFYSGVIPLYLGAPDIENYIPENSFINLNNFSDISEAWKYASNIPDSELENIRQAGKNFIDSAHFRLFFDSLFNIVKEI
ncbi:MAG: glycosyltransferase family 10 domain-containing protein [Polynucleobacter sp.]